MSGPNYARLKGPGDFDAPEEMEFFDDSQIDERAEELAGLYAGQSAKQAEAHEWIDGTMDYEWYSAVERTLCDLHYCGAAELLGSDLLERLYRLARPIGEAFENKIGEMAREDAEAEFANFESNSPDGDE